MIQKMVCIIRTGICAAVAVCLFSISNCSFPSGGGSEAGNAKIVGKVVDSLGVPVGNAMITVRESVFDPVKDKKNTNTTAYTTSSEGIYEAAVHVGGIYTVEAKLAARNTYALVAEVPVPDIENTAPQCTLRTPGVMKIKVPQNADRKLGYVYIPGTSVFALLGNTADFVFLNDVPAGMISSVSYSSTDTQEVSVIRQDINVQSGDTSVVYNPFWLYSRQLILNTASSGAAVSGNVVNFPLCVRLTADFNFNQAASDGSDILFTKDDGTALPYEIENWDKTANMAQIWVSVDTIHGDNSSQYIAMYWGNPAIASAESNGSAVFDTTSGFQGVWHMAGNGTVFDATVNRYNGTPYGTAVSSAVQGAIGAARSFDGKAAYIAMPNTAAGKLDMPQNGTYTVSMWVYADMIDTLWHVIAGKGHEQYYMKFKCFRNNSATWEFVEFQDSKGWEFTEDSIPPSPGAGQWVYLTGVRSGTKQYLYINGILVSDSIHIQNGNYAKNTGDDFLIGRSAREVTIPNSEGWCYFKGMVDEVRVMNVALTADWIRLDYINQKTEDQLVKFR